MKKTLLVLAAFLATNLVVIAQDVDGEKLAKSAGKALTSYNIDPQNNASKLEEAKTKIEEALSTPSGKALPAAWITKGDVYNTLLQRDLAQRMINPKAPLSGDNDALAAFDGYKTAYNMVEAKKFQKNEAVKGITEVQGSLINIGVSKYEEGKHDKAFASFTAALESHEILAAAGKKSLLDEPEQMENQLFFTAVVASLAGMTQQSADFYEKLYKKGTNKPEVYSGLYKAKLELKDEAGAEKILAEGRKKFPEDAGLLFDEINAYLVKGKLDELTSSLKSAIDKEPTNVGLYVTLGNVYDNLYQREIAAKNETKSKEYFDLALNYYQQANKLDPKNVDAIYAMGALYYNKAALLTQELNALPEDFSAAGTKKYNELKDKVMALFESALPHFRKAESLDPNDQNTLIALSEIFARQDDFTLVKEFKGRLEVVRGGGKNQSSYFKE